MLGRKEINEFIDQKINWSSSTKHTARSKLYTMLDIGFTPDKCYQYLNDRNYSKYTIKTYFILASNFNKSFSVFLKSNSNIFRNAYKEKTESITLDKVNLLLIAAKNTYKNLYNLIYLMAFCGLRLSEAQSAKWSDIKENSYLEVTGKGDKLRQVPVNINDLFPPSSPEAYIAGPVNPRQFLALYNTTPHSLRAFFITHTLRSKILDLDEVQKIVGHTSLLTTQRYIRFNLNTAIEKLKNGLYDSTRRVK